MSGADVMGLKSAWDELFGVTSSVDPSSSVERAPAVTSAVDRADSWLDSTPEVTSNHHSEQTGSSLFDSSTMFDDAFLDGIVGVSRAGEDDVWDSSTTDHHDAFYSRSPFDDVAAFPDTTSVRTTTGSDEMARPRPRPQATPATATNTANPFSVTLQAATAAARSAVEGFVINAFHIFIS